MRRTIMRVDRLNIKAIKVICFFVLFIAVFLNFRFNIFGAVDKKWFGNHQLDSDGLVVHKLYADTIGVNTPCLLGRFVELDYSKDKDLLRKEDLLTWPSKNPENFRCYNSQVGLSTLILKPFWAASSLIFENDPRRVLYSFRVIKTITALINAFVVSLFFFWIFLEFNSKILFFIFSIFILFKQDWVVVFGKSVYWQIWSWYAPLVFNLYFLRKIFDTYKNIITMRQYLLMAGANFVLVYIKCLMGYEYISTILIASILPFIYYSFKFNKKELLKSAVVFLFFGLAAFLLAFGTHYFLLELNEFNAKEIMEAIILKRTYAQDLSSIPDVYHKSLKANVFAVLKKYIFHEKQLLLFVVFAGSFLYSFKCNLFKRDLKHQSLLAMILVSFIGSNSWYVLAKGHSYIHTGMNRVLWFLPLNYLIYIFFIWTIKHAIEDNFEIKIGLKRS